MSSAGCGSGSCRISSYAASYTALIQLLILIVPLLYLGPFCRAAAMRLPPPTAVPGLPPVARREELLHKYSGNKNVFFDLDNQKGWLKESNRRVPSCPDPLHN
ncbi:hypothetical protein SAY87_012915 [Trapa incisa]|uniref:Uncharacterized protein n=1 Tax=Trapa incisa TaxID=236973 RepID=A0AAN7KH20_9MYRT|nr:hypothetical protein SAY87_012915 [Trapa incisa]